MAIISLIEELTTSAVVFSITMRRGSGRSGGRGRLGRVGSRKARSSAPRSATAIWRMARGRRGAELGS